MKVVTASYAETVAGVAAAIAAYAQAVDDGRYRDIGTLFCADGLADLPGDEVMAGRSRHVVTGTHVTRWSAEHAVAISDLIVVGPREAGPWAIRSVGRYFDLLHRQDGGWLFHSRTLRFADDG